MRNSLKMFVNTSHLHESHGTNNIFLLTVSDGITRLAEKISKDVIEVIFISNAGLFYFSILFLILANDELTFTTIHIG